MARKKTSAKTASGTAVSSTAPANGSAPTRQPMSATAPSNGPTNATTNNSENQTPATVGIKNSSGSSNTKSQLPSPEKARDTEEKPTVLRLPIETTDSNNQSKDLVVTTDLRTSSASSTGMANDTTTACSDNDRKYSNDSDAKISQAFSRNSSTTDGRISTTNEESMWQNIAKQIFTGLVASLVAEMITLPMETIKIMQQVNGEPVSKLAKDIFASKGISGFFHGTGPRLFQTVVSNVGFFFFQALLKDSGVFNPDPNGPDPKKGPSLVLNLALNMISQQVNRCFCLPLEVVANGVQSSLDSGGAMAVIKKVYKEDGLPGFWKGLIISLVLSLNPALMFTLVEKLQIVVRTITAAEHITASQMFQISALAKMIATVVTYPLIRAKTVMQTSKLSNDSTTGGILSKIYVEEGFLGWYKGVWVLSYKTVLFNALMMAVKTTVTKVYYDFIAGTRGITDGSSAPVDVSPSVESPTAKREIDELKKAYREKVELLSSEAPWEAAHKGKEVLYLAGAWNFLHPSHQHLLQSATSRPNCHVIIGIHDEETRLANNGTECQEEFEKRVHRIRNYRSVGSILLRAPWCIDKNLMKSLGITKVLAGRRCSADPRDPYYIPAERNVFEFVEDPYDGMWRRMVRVIFSNVDGGPLATTSPVFRASNTSKRKSLYSKDRSGIEKVSGEGKGLLRKNSWYFLHQLTEPDSRPPEYTQRERDLAAAEKRRSDTFGSNLGQSMTASN